MYHTDVGREEVIEAWPQKVESGKNRCLHRCSWDDLLELKKQEKEAGVCTYCKGWSGSPESLWFRKVWVWNWLFSEPSEKY